MLLLLLLKDVCVSSDNWIRLGICEFCELVLGFSRLLVSGRFVYRQPPIWWLIDNFSLLSLALFLRVKEGQGALVTITTTTIATLTRRTMKQCVVGSSCENGCSLVSLALFFGIGRDTHNHKFSYLPNYDTNSNVIGY